MSARPDVRPHAVAPAATTAPPCDPLPDTTGATRAERPVDALAGRADGLVARTYVNGDIHRAEPRLRVLLASLGHPTSVHHDPAWLRAEAFEHGCSSLLVSLERGDRIVAAAPFLVRPWRWRARLGYASVASFAVTLADLAGDSFIAPDDFAIQERLALAVACAPVRYDLIYFEALPVESLLYRVLAQSPHVRHAFWIDQPATRSIHWRLAVPSSFDEYLERETGDARRRRRRVFADAARCVRKFEKDCKHPAQLHRITRREQVQWFLERVEHVSERSWQGMRLGSIVRPTSRAVEAYGQRADRGFLRSYLLTDGDEPVSFAIGVQDDSTYHLEQFAYDRARRPQSPGKVLLYKLLEDLHAERTPTRFDFGTGDHEYKRDFGTDQYDETNLYLVRKSLGTAAARATCTSVATLNAAVHAALDRFELRARVRQLLRGRSGATEPRG